MKQKKHSNVTGKGFYIALSCSIAMVGAACYFAYTQTAGRMVEQLDSNGSESQMELQTEPSTQKPISEYSSRITTAAVAEQSANLSTTTHTTAVTVPLPVVDVAVDTIVTETVTEAAIQTAAAPPVLPVNGEVLNPFSGGELVKSATTGIWQTHNGVDLAASIGDSVVSMAAGTVQSVKNDALWGVCVTIDHGAGLVSRYCGLAADVTVSEGDTITGGTVLGAVGSTAEAESAEPSHLHFEVLQNETYIDPIVKINGSE